MPQPVADRFPDLSHLQRVGQASTIKIVLTAPKDLGLALQPAEGRSVQDPVAVYLKGRAEVTLTLVTGSPFGIKDLIKAILHDRGVASFSRSSSPGQITQFPLLRGRESMVIDHDMKPVLCAFLFLIAAPSSEADIERFSMVKTDSLTIKSEDGTATLRVGVERFNRDELKTVEREGNFSVWHGKRRLPFDVMLIPTMIKDFELTIDGKKVNVPKNFWNDIGGFQLRKVEIDPKRPVITPEDEAALEEFLEENVGTFPTISRTPQGSTILITWARPEE
jgi:hypothetical protein